jgi:hypothetical protein
MKNVKIWYLSDNGNGADIIEKIKKIGLKVEHVTDINKKLKLPQIGTNILIFDLKNKPLDSVIEFIKSNDSMYICQKFILLSKKDVSKAIDYPTDIPHTEFLVSPLNTREFILLLEKTVIVESYRDVLKYISNEANARIEAYENLMDINRSNILMPDNEKEKIQNFLDFEKTLAKKQTSLNNSIKKYTARRRKEMFFKPDNNQSEYIFSDLKEQEKQ